MCDLNEFYLKYIAVDSPDEERLQEFVLKLWDEFNEGLFASVMAKVRNPSLSADICQDAYVKAMAKLRMGASRRSDLYFRAWLHRIAANLIVDHFRRTNRIEYGWEAERRDNGTPDRAQTSVASDDVPVPELIGRAQELEVLRECLESLPEPDKQYVTLCDINGMPQNAVAKKFKLPTATMFRRLRAARDKLRECFELRTGLIAGT